MDDHSDSRTTVLYIDDGASDRGAIQRNLQDDPQIRLTEIKSPDELIRLLNDRVHAVVLSELRIWTGPELGILDMVRSTSANVPVVILTAHGSEEWAVKALRQGAADYISRSTPGYLATLANRLLAQRKNFVARPPLNGGPLGGSEPPIYQPASQRDLEQLFAHALRLLSIVGFDGNLKWANSGWAKNLGYCHDEIVGLPLLDLMHPDHRPAALELVDRLKKGRSTGGVESPLRCRDGTYKWLLWNAVPCVEQQVYLITAHDITGRKKTEEQLRESQERFQLLASVTKEAVWDWDLRENRIWSNESHHQMFGEANGSADGVVDRWVEQLHPDDRERILAALPTPISNGMEQWTLEYRRRLRSGAYAHVYDRGFTIFNDHGEPVRKVGSVLDISVLKNTEEKLRESEQRFQFVAQATRDAIWDWDLDKNQVWRSEGFKTFGYEPEDVGCDVEWGSERVHPDDRERVFAQISPHGAGPQQHTLEYRFRRADGTYADVIDRGFLMCSPDGKPIRMIGSMMDISERRRAEALAHMQQAELAHIARVSTMGEIATGLAHELNQPLTAISNYAESCAQALVKRGSVSDDKLLSWIEKISANTHRAGEMIRRLRGFTKRSEPTRLIVEVNALIEEVIDLVEAETRLKSIRIRWERVASTHVSVDRIQVQQVLVNLLRNAFEAMVANEPARRQVTIAASNTDKTIELSVADLGEGIAADDMERVFEAFFTNKPNGVGIGLAISRSIVEDHGGRLWVVPNPQQGVTFHFTLPLAGAQDAASTDSLHRGR